MISEFWLFAVKSGYAEVVENLVLLMKSHKIDIDKLIDYDQMINYNHIGEITTLMFACTNGHDAIVKILLEKGTSPISADANSIFGHV